MGRFIAGEGRVDEADLLTAIKTAQAIGDDRLQRQQQVTLARIALLTAPQNNVRHGLCAATIVAILNLVIHLLLRH